MCFLMAFPQQIASTSSVESMPGTDGSSTSGGVSNCEEDASLNQMFKCFVLMRGERGGEQARSRHGHALAYILYSNFIYLNCAFSPLVKIAPDLFYCKTFNTYLTSEARVHIQTELASFEYCWERNHCLLFTSEQDSWSQYKISHCYLTYMFP